MITLLTKVIIFSKKEKQFKSCFQVSVDFGMITLKRFTCLIVELDEEERRERQLYL